MYFGSSPLINRNHLAVIGLPFPRFSNIVDVAISPASDLRSLESCSCGMFLNHLNRGTAILAPQYQRKKKGEPKALPSQKRQRRYQLDRVLLIAKGCPEESIGGRRG